jgi:predicted DNA-binding transcriptional regulator AlpA
MRDDPTNEKSNVPTTPEPDDELWDLPTVRKFFGGVHRTTIYRNLGTIYPKPINTSPNTVRWIAHECREARARMRDERGSKPKSRRGRPRRHLTVV